MYAGFFYSTLQSHASLGTFTCSYYSKVNTSHKPTCDAVSLSFIRRQRKTCGASVGENVYL